MNLLPRPDLSDFPARPGERLLWEGHPGWWGMARDVLHLRAVALYFVCMFFLNAASDQGSGIGSSQTMRAGLPLLLLGAGVVGGLALLAWAMAHTTHYAITTQRCILLYGLAIQARLSIPLHAVSVVALRMRRDGTADIPLRLQPESRKVHFMKLWPHVRPWRLEEPEPMLRGVTSGAAVGTLLSRAVAAARHEAAARAAPPMARAA